MRVFAGLIINNPRTYPSLITFVGIVRRSDASPLRPQRSIESDVVG